MSNVLVYKPISVVNHGKDFKTVYSDVIKKEFERFEENKTVVYVSKVAEILHKPVKNVVLYQLSHYHYDYTVLVIDGIDALKNNQQNTFTALLLSCCAGCKTYIYDNATGARVFIPAYDRRGLRLAYKYIDTDKEEKINAERLYKHLQDVYEDFQWNVSDKICETNIARLEKDVVAMQEILGNIEIPNDYISYTKRNAKVYDITLPKTHFSTVRNIYHREGTERGTRNTIGHCVGVDFNRIVDEEPDYVLELQYKIAYLTIRYYQMLGSEFEPNKELYIQCPHCKSKGRIEWIKRKHLAYEECFCEYCGKSLPDNLAVEVFDNISNLF